MVQNDREATLSKIAIFLNHYFLVYSLNLKADELLENKTRQGPTLLSWEQKTQAHQTKHHNGSEKPCLSNNSKV